MPIDQKQVESEVVAGLPNEKDRIGDAFDNVRYSEGRFEEYPTRTKDGRYNAQSARRTSPVFRRVMEVLSQNLYKSQPTRKLRDPVTTEWLAQVYRSAEMSPKWHRADQLTLVTGFCAMLWKGTTDPTSPVASSLWGGHELAVWVDPDDATKPGAVATIERHDSGRRLRLYTESAVVTYETPKGTDGPAFGGTAFREVSRARSLGGYKEVARKPNRVKDDEGRGIIPFSFCHWSYPTQEFTTNGPGCNLRELNQSVNERLDRLGDSIHFLGRPVGVAQGLDEGWRPPAEIKPGDFIMLPPASTDVAGNGTAPTLSYLMADTGYVVADWADLNNYLDHNLEMHGVPPVLVRMVQASARSGASIQAEQTPLLTWIESRRSLWSLYEEQAARMAVTVGAAHMQANGQLRTANRLRATLEDWQYSIHWPSLYVQLPGPERDQADDWRLQRQLVSKVGILQERYDFTEEEALEYLAKVAAQIARLRAMGIDAGLPQTGFGAAFGGPPAADQAGAEQQPTDQAEQAPTEAPTEAPPEEAA